MCRILLVFIIIQLEYSPGLSNQILKPTRRIPIFELGVLNHITSSNKQAGYMLMKFSFKSNSSRVLLRIELPKYPQHGWHNK